MIDSINWSDSRKHRPEATRQIERGTSRKAVDTRWPRGEGGGVKRSDRSSPHSKDSPYCSSYSPLSFSLCSTTSTSTSACHAIAAFTRTVASSGENEKTKNLQEQYLMRKGEGKRKKTQQVSKKLQNPKREKRFSPDTFVISTLTLFSLQMRQCSPHHDRSPSVSGYRVSRSRRSVCHTLCRRFLARETTTHTWPEPETEPQLQTRTRNEPHMRPLPLPEPNSGLRQSVPNLMRA